MQQPPQQNNKNVLIFVVAMALCFAVWYGLKTWLFPTPPAPTPPPEPPPGEVYTATAALAAAEGGFGQALGQVGLLAQAVGRNSEAKAPPKVEAPPAPVVTQKPPTPPEKYRHLGDKARDSKFHLYVDLDPRGVGAARGAEQVSAGRRPGPAGQPAGRLTQADGAGVARPRKSIQPAPGLRRQQQERRQAARHPRQARLVQRRRSTEGAGNAAGRPRPPDGVVRVAGGAGLPDHQDVFADRGRLPHRPGREGEAAENGHAGRQGAPLPLPALHRSRPAGRGPLVHQHLPQFAGRPGRERRQPGTAASNATCRICEQFP